MENLKSLELLLPLSTAYVAVQVKSAGVLIYKIVEPAKDLSMNVKVSEYRVTSGRGYWMGFEMIASGNIPQLLQPELGTLC